MEKITIFTPTYNRAHTLTRLYDSLKTQTIKNFIWLIVDDGSQDYTSSLINSWIKENPFKIEYHKQDNFGKSRAHNKGVELTKTELFTCVDSDDFLMSTAIEDILMHWDSRDKLNAVGILAYKGLVNGKGITVMQNNHIKSTTLKNAYSKLGLKGDTMLVFRTDILSKYQFPKYQGEKFVPEAFLYDLVDQDGELLILPNILYVCEYLDDGYTNNIAKLLSENPKGYIAYINNRLRLDTSLKDRITDTIRYTAMCILSNQNKYISDSIYPLITFITYPLGYFMYFKRYKKFEKN